MFVASDIHGLATLRELVWDSIRVRCCAGVALPPLKRLTPTPLQYSALDDDEQKEAFVMLEGQWNTFVRYILEKYGKVSGTEAEV